MNPGLAGALVDLHIRDLQRQRAPRRAGTRHGARPARPGRRWAGVRSRVGFTLVETGLRLLTTGQQTVIEAASGARAPVESPPRP